MNRVCILIRLSSSEFKDSVPVNVSGAFKAMLFCIGACEEHAEHFLATAMSSRLYVFKVHRSTSGAPFRGRLKFTNHIVSLLVGKFEV